MEANNLTTAILSALAIFFVVLKLKRLRREEFRTDIRQIRDELFDFMWKNDLDYSDLYYRSLRQSLNGLLRISNVASLPKFFVIAALAPINDDADDIARCPNPILRARLECARGLAAKRLVKYLFGEGIVGGLLWMILQALTLTFKSLTTFSKCRTWVTRSVAKYLSAVRDFHDTPFSGTHQYLSH